MSYPSVPPSALEALRSELDRLDDQLHDVLMRRAAVVEQVAALNAKGRVPLRPGREAAILHRLLARHAGALPPRTLVRLWRELFAGTTAMQGDIVIAAPPAQAMAAREHFGALTTLRLHDAPEAALDAVRTGEAAAAVLPAPGESDWWLHLDAASPLHVVARLPFWAPRPAGVPAAEAYVVTANLPDPSGSDRTLLRVRAGADEAWHALDAAGAQPVQAARQGDAVLFDLAGFEAPSLPPRHGATVLGAYAVPVTPH